MFLYMNIDKLFLRSVFHDMRVDFTIKQVKVRFELSNVSPRMRTHTDKRVFAEHHGENKANMQNKQFQMSRSEDGKDPP